MSDLTAWFADLATAVPQLAWLARADGAIERSSARWAELTGATPDASPDAESWLGRVHREDVEQARNEWTSAVHSRHAFQHVLRIENPRSGAPQALSCLAVPLSSFEDGQPRWLGFLIDPRLADASRRRDDFLAVLAHELRNPLAPIRNWVTVLREGTTDAVKQKEAWEVIDRQLHRLTRLVDDLFDATRISEGKIRLRKETFELRPAITEAIQVVAHELESRGHRLDVALPAERLQIEADPARFEQILVNLLGNAARYTENGGSIEVSARGDDRELVLCVKDSGVGIPEEMLSTIFEPYTQIDGTWRRHHGGLGIGLAIVRTLVSMHGGTVEARSGGAGLGSEFAVRMPVVQGVVPVEAHQALVARPPTATVSSARRILVVDDNEDSAISLSMLLKARSHDVRVAHDGPSAIQIACEYGPDVVLLDLGLPGMDGCEVASHLRDRPETQMALLVAVTGYAHEEAREKARRAGFDHHLVKPVLLRDLLAVISRR